MVESMIRYSKSGSSDIASKMRPDTLEAPSAEAPEHTVPIPKCLRKITPGGTGAHDPKHPLHEHPIIAARRTLLIGPTYDQRRHPLPCCVAQNQTVLHTQDGLPKAALNLICS